MRRLLVGMAAVASNLGWLQVAPAFGFPVTAPAAMLDRMLGPSREIGAAGWAMLLLGQAAFAALSFVAVERRTRVALTSLAFAVGAWLISGAVLMPLVGLIQGAPAPNTPAAMQASFFMLNLGPYVVALYPAYKISLQSTRTSLQSSPATFGDCLHLPAKPARCGCRRG